jgi:hypothetical protein
MAFVEMDDAPRISWRDHFHEVEVYVTAGRVAELHGYESCHHCLLFPPTGLACAFAGAGSLPIDTVAAAFTTSISQGRRVSFHFGSQSAFTGRLSLL